MKKIISTTILMSIALTSCGTTGENQTTDAGEIGGTITVVTSFTDAEEKFEEIENEFIEMYPDVEDVVWESTGGDYDEYITTRMTSGDYGDVLLVPFSMTSDPEELGSFLEPLGTTEEVESKYNFADQAVYDGHTYALPISLNSLGLIYNENVFKEAGVQSIPTSSEEMYEACQLVVENTNAIPWYTNLNTMPMLWSGAVTSYGGEQYVSDILESGTIVQEGQPYREVLDFIYTMIVSGYTEADPMTGDLMHSMQMVADGNAGFIVMGSQSLEDMMYMSETPEAIKMAPFPVMYNGEFSLGFGADELMGISANSENKATAKAFVEFFLSSESGFAFGNGGFSPEKGDQTGAPEFLAYQTEEFEAIRTIPSEDVVTMTKFNDIGRDANITSVTRLAQDVANIAVNGEDYDAYLNEIEADWSEAVLKNEQ